MKKIETVEEAVGNAYKEFKCWATCRALKALIAKSFKEN